MKLRAHGSLPWWNAPIDLQHEPALRFGPDVTRAHRRALRRLLRQCSYGLPQPRMPIEESHEIGLAYTAFGAHDRGQSAFLSRTPALDSGQDEHERPPALPGQPLAAGEGPP